MHEVDSTIVNRGVVWSSGC